MSEEKVRMLTEEMVTKQLLQAKIKREKGSQADITRLDAEILTLKREINFEIRALSEEQVHVLDVETDDTQRNR
jgi:hypothetical protein